MKIFKYFIVLLAVLLSGNEVFAQYQGAVYLPNTSIKVYAYGNEQTMAWCGGFNNPQLQMADLNKDGIQDLVVFEPYIGVRTFINNGTAGNPIYVYAPQYALNFPAISDYMLLKDYNCDGIPDLFDEGNTGFAASRGYYNAQNQLCFAYYKNLFYHNDSSVNGWVNAYNNPSDIPAIVDIDNDGDIDFLSYNVIGGNINFYKNMRVEKGLPCDSIVIVLADRCWGRVYQATQRTHTLKYTCDESKLNLNPALNKVTHQGNTLCLFDYDGDGDYDYLDGNISFNEMTFLQNGRIPYEQSGPDSMVFQDTTWPKNGHSIEMPTWPAAFSVDVDQDGKTDIVVAPNLQNSSDNYKCIWFYKNESTAGHPSYVFQSDTFLVDRSIDLGTAAYPALFDYNKDGKPDLIVGSDGYYQSNGSLKSRLSYYLNTSTPGNPSFTLQTTNFLNIDAYDYRGAAPTFGDLDNDGKQDMLIGHSDGTLSLFTNAAATDNVQPNWQPDLAQQPLKDLNNNIITVNNNAAPFIYDLNKDGKPDLIIGSLSGSLTYYKNVSTIPGVVLLLHITDTLGGVMSDPKLGFGGYSTPFIGKLDNTGQDYLLMGSSSGSLYRFDGFETGVDNGDFRKLDDQYSYIDSDYQVYKGGTGQYGNLRSAPVVGDIDNDGKYEMFVGMVYGGIQLYKQSANAGITNVNAAQGMDINVYPNPAKNDLTIAFNETLKENAQVRIINIAGQQLFATTAVAGKQSMNIPLAGLPSGMYICILEVNNTKYYNRFTVLK